LRIVFRMMSKGIAGLLVLAGLAAACDLPRDPEHTLDKVTGGVIRVGYAVDSPWVTESAGAPAGVEPQLINDLARRLHSRVAWIKGPEARLMKAVQMRQLDIAIGGFEKDSPWGTEVALTRPYYDEKHVLAVPMGENAWLVRVEQHLQDRQSSIPVMLRTLQ
jgi:polar amino acid transport system substrate-binding protein